MIIHSFDRIMREPRSWHSFEVLPGRRIALPRPVPRMSAVYFVALFVFMLALDNVVPITDAVVALFSPVAPNASVAAWLITYIFVPVAIVYFATNAHVDGRSPHRWVVSVWRYVVRPKRTRSGRTLLADGARVSYRGRIKVWWDISAPRLHHGWIRGGSVTTTVPVRFTHAIRHKSLVVKTDEDGSPLSEYDVGDNLEVKP